jgi:hypothetical protein
LKTNFHIADPLPVLQIAFVAARSSGGCSTHATDRFLDIHKNYFLVVTYAEQET